MADEAKDQNMNDEIAAYQAELEAVQAKLAAAKAAATGAEAEAPASEAASDATPVEDPVEVPVETPAETPAETTPIEVTPVEATDTPVIPTSPVTNEIPVIPTSPVSGGASNAGWTAPSSTSGAADAEKAIPTSPTGQVPPQGTYVPPQATYAPPQSPYGQQPYPQATVSTKDHVAAGLLAIFLGGLGIHKFYLGYTTSGFIMLGVWIIGWLFFGLGPAAMAIIGLVEGIVYLTKSQAEFEQLYVYNKREWF